jgi:hypothetical protein
MRRSRVEPSKEKQSHEPTFLFRTKFAQTNAIGLLEKDASSVPLKKKKGQDFLE